MLGDARLREKLRKIEALFAGAGTEGERLAAEAALARIRARLAEFSRSEAPVEMHWYLPELKALTAKCAHLDCTVQYRVERSDIWCACHNGTYDTKGTNVAGPPPRPLTPLEVLTRGEKIVLKRA